MCAVMSDLVAWILGTTKRQSTTDSVMTLMGKVCAHLHVIHYCTQPGYDPEASSFGLHQETDGSGNLYAPHCVIYRCFKIEYIHEAGSFGLDELLSEGSRKGSILTSTPCPSRSRHPSISCASGICPLLAGSLQGTIVEVIFSDVISMRTNQRGCLGPGRIQKEVSRLASRLTPLDEYHPQTISCVNDLVYGD